MLRLAFAGTPATAARVLEYLLTHSPHDIRAVYTQPDRPAGRGRRLRPSAVKELAVDSGLPVRQPASATELEADPELAAVDALIVVAYGVLLTPPILQSPRHGCINLHFSLLPRWRGAAPVQRALLAGDHESGISLMQMDAGLDTGPVLDQRVEAIRPDDTTASLQARLADLGAQALLEILPRLDRIRPRPQDEARASYAPKIHKQETRLDWRQPAAELARAVRAYTPAPGASAALNGVECKLWEVTPVAASPGVPAGTLVAAGKTGIDVATGAGILRITRLQPAGGRSLSAAEFLNGRPDFAATSHP